MRVIQLFATLFALTAILPFAVCGCGSRNSSSGAYGNLPVGHPGPSSAFARSIPTLTPAQRDAVLAKKFGRNKAKGAGPHP